MDNPSILPFPLETLVYRALDRWDDIVVVLQVAEAAADGLIFHSVNQPFCRASGYADVELLGRPFRLIAGADTDATALAELERAAREGRSDKIELLCAGKTGQAFWLGMHLMPVSEAPELCIILGRDITKAMVARRREANMQGLLAKVFLSVDAAVAIVGSDDRFLMTNPFLDRLFGHPPNSLVGRTTSELIPVEERNAIAAARERQMQDGLEYDLDVSLLRIDGARVSCRVHSAVIDALDRRKFCIITARPLVVPSPNAKPMRSVIAGKIKLVGLDEVKAALGDRWPATAERAMTSAELIIRSSCGPRDTFSRTIDSSFIVYLADMSEADASFRAAMLARDIRYQLIGKGESGSRAYVSAITATLQVPDTPETVGSRLTAIVGKALVSRLNEIEEEARAALRATLEDLVCELEPLCGRSPEQVVAEFVGIPKSAAQQICSALAALPMHEAQAVDLDALLLDLAADQATAGLSRGKGQPLFVEVGFELFEIRAHTERYIAACRKLDIRLRQRLVFVLTHMPESTPRSRMLDCISRLRPFCRMVGLAIDRPSALPADLSLSGAPIVVMEAQALATAPVAEQVKLIARLHISRTQLLVRHVASWNDGIALLSAGVDMLSVSER